MMARRPAWLPWAAGYGSLVAGLLSLAAVPALASGGTASAVLLGLTGLAQVLWGAVFILQQTSSMVTSGSVLQGAALGAAAVSSLPIPAGALPLDPALTVMRLAAGVTCLACLLAGLPWWVPADASRRLTRLPALIVVAALSAGVWSGAWVAAATLRLPFPVPAAATAARETPTPHTVVVHPEKETHQATFRVRLNRQQVGPYFVDAFTGPAEVGHLFVEVRVSDETGRPVQGLVIDVEASPTSGEAAIVNGPATPELAEVPGDYAVSLAVPSSGFWEVVVRIGGPLGVQEVSFSERVGGTASVAGWVLAGVPLAIAVLFGLVYLRTAGRRRG